MRNYSGKSGAREERGQGNCETLLAIFLTPLGGG